MIMMFGRGFVGGNIGNGYFGNGNIGNGGYGNGFCGFGRWGNFGSGDWSLLIGLGIIVVIALIIFYIVHNNKKNETKNNAYDILQMKFVQGTITEEEYLRRKDILGRQ